MRRPISEAVEVARMNLHNLCTVQEWAEAMGYSNPKQFSKHFRNHFGERPMKVLTRLKIKQVEKLLNNGQEMKHFLIARKVGLPDEQALYKFIKYHTGEAPTSFKKTR